MFKAFLSLKSLDALGHNRLCLVSPHKPTCYLRWSLRAGTAEFDVPSERRTYSIEISTDEGALRVTKYSGLTAFLTASDIDDRLALAYRFAFELGRLIRDGYGLSSGPIAEETEDFDASEGEGL